MTAALRRAWDRLSLYLPVLLMGLLALATWWLVRNAPQPQEQRAPAAPRHEPDYQMNGFSVRSFAADGRLQSEVQGQTARHYPDTDTLEIDQVRIRSAGQAGRAVHATADRALSNADGSEVQLFGNAVVVREAAPGQPRLEFRGEFLHAWPNEERVRSHLPVTLTRGSSRFTADSMEYDNLAQVLQLRGHVRGVLAPGR
ncbi:LPS export ABC transporter periplasmic protein LptC [Comamonas granuli]|uniref:LPS export ABC transporter periplasmic protein LptC n=1 Tax=Comamonas granuli TaxID=290309 RepID=UPI0005A8E8EB|nr:LPS export ABC transporter periplasmic protein LptC [Comamonas granuli]